MKHILKFTIAMTVLFLAHTGAVAHASTVLTTVDPHFVLFDKCVESKMGRAVRIYYAKDSSEVFVTMAGLGFFAPAVTNSHIFSSQNGDFKVTLEKDAHGITRKASYQFKDGAPVVFDKCNGGVSAD